MPRKAPNKPLTLYRVFIDYEAAGVNAPSTADKKIYESRAGLNQKIQAALSMGVHPKFIQVMSITSATWTSALDYAQKDSPLVLCKECNKPFAEPSDNCRLLTGVLRINEARTRHAKPGVKVTLLERPHPQLFMIDELCITNHPEPGTDVHRASPCRTARPARRTTTTTTTHRGNHQ